MLPNDFPSFGNELILAALKPKKIKKHQPRTLKNPLSPKKEAHRQVQWAVREGLIKKPSKCAFCNQKRRIDAHHDDYKKPLEIRWLCRSCHMTWHKYNQPKNAQLAQNHQKTRLKVQ